MHLCYAALGLLAACQEAPYMLIREAFLDFLKIVSSITEIRQYRTDTLTPSEISTEWGKLSLVCGHTRNTKVNLGNLEFMTKIYL